MKLCLSKSMSLNSASKCCIIIHHYQVYQIALYLSWTMIKPITTQNQWNTHGNSSVIRLLMYDVITSIPNTTKMFKPILNSNHFKFHFKYYSYFVKFTIVTNFTFDKKRVWPYELTYLTIHSREPSRALTHIGLLRLINLTNATIETWRGCTGINYTTTKETDNSTSKFGEATRINT